MKLEIDSKEIGSLLQVSIDTSGVTNLMRRSLFEILAKEVTKQTRSYMTVETLQSPDCSVSISNDNKIVITMTENLKPHGSEELVEKQFLVDAPELLHLFLAIYYMDRSKNVSTDVKVEYGTGWEEQKEKEA